MIRLQQIALTLRSGKTLLHPINIEWRPGTVAAITGPNGAGKSTLLKLLSGDWKPTQGIIEWHGTPLDQWNPLPLSRNRAVLPQSSHVPFAFTALELVMLGRYAYRGHVAEQRKLAMEMLDRVDASSLANRSVHTLSGGELQRVQFARVLAQLENPTAEFPPVLLLDEPTSNLDPSHQHALLRMSVEHAQRNHTIVIIVLHDLNLTLQYASQVTLLQNGKLIARGTPNEVLQPAAVESVFHLRTTLCPHPQHNYSYLLPY